MKNEELNFRIEEANAHIESGKYCMEKLGDYLASGDLITAGSQLQMAIAAARAARSHLAFARMELAREIVQEIDSGNGIATPAEWALATKILKPLRLVRTKGGK